MTDAQYRCIVAHMCSWARGIDEAMSDCLITDSKEYVIEELDKAGWVYSEETDTLEYQDYD